MAQQINLYSPILLTPRRYFPARAMLQVLALLAAGLLAAAAWATVAARAVQAELAATAAVTERQKSALMAELARQPALPSDPAVLQAQLAQTRALLQERRTALADLDAAADPGHAALLQLLAQTVPASVWLTEVRRGATRLELAGMTVQPEALRPWLASLQAHPLLAGTPLRTVKIERDRTEAAEATWRFRVISSRGEGEGS